MREAGKIIMLRNTPLMVLLVEIKQVKWVCQDFVSGGSAFVLPVESGEIICFGVDGLFSDIKGLWDGVEMEQAATTVQGKS